MTLFLNLSHPIYECFGERERERDSLPLAGSSYWLSLNPWNKIADRNLSLFGLCHIFLSLAFPSTPPLLWIPFTWADRSSMWGGEKKKHLHILDSLVDQYKSFFFFEPAIIKRDTELRRLLGLFQVWSKENFDKPTTLREKGLSLFSSSTDWKHSTADF